MLDSLLTAVDGGPIPAAVLSDALGIGSSVCEVVPGSELRQAGSHTGLLRDASNDASRTVFLKKVTALLIGSKPWRHLCESICGALHSTLQCLHTHNTNTV